MNDEISLSQLIPWLISGIAMICTVLSFLRNGKKDTVNDVVESTEFKTRINTKLDQICATTSDIQSDIKAVQKTQNEQGAKILLIERDLNTCFARVDELRDMINS